jgi:hypothetical protein
VTRATSHGVSRAMVRAVPRAALAVSALLAAAAWPAPAAADDDEPAVHEVWYDGELRPHPRNPSLDRLVAGDTVIVHVDTTRLFPDSDVKEDEPGFDPDEAPPAVRGFYVVSVSAGSRRPLLVQKGSCGIAALRAAATAKEKDLKDARKTWDTVKDDTNALDDAKAAAKQALDDAGTAAQDAAKAVDDHRVTRDANAGLCRQEHDWELDDKGLRPYVCKNGTSLADLVALDSTWSLIQRVGDDEHECREEWDLKLGPAVSLVTAEIAHGNGAPEPMTLANNKGVWTGKYAIKANSREIRLRLQDADSTERSRTLSLRASSRDTHSLVRIQAEVLATNRLRTVSFAMAVTPVRRKFFTEGPWECWLGCTIVPAAFLRISGDEKTIVQLGGGVGIYMVRAFQINGGMLFGSSDANTAVRFERNWFVGIALDPVILAEAMSGNKAKP